VPVAHTCNPGYLGGRAQEDGSLKPTWANSSRNTALKKIHQKKGWWSGSRCKPVFKPQYCKKKKKKKKIEKTLN
jgi:hypothetical protein